MLPHIFSYLKQHESENRAQLLKDILLIDPAYYEKGANPATPASSSPDPASSAPAED
jgi:hypothetical protein